MLSRQINTVEIHEDNGDDGDNVTKTKRRRKGKGTKAARKNRDNGTGEYFDLDGQHGEIDDLDDAHDVEIKDHQLGFYTGDIRRLVALAIVYM